MIKVIINEDHALLDEQREILERLGEWERVNLPRTGMTTRELEGLADELWAAWCDDHDTLIVMAFPVAYLVKLLLGNLDEDRVKLFFNAHREKVELPNGQIIFKIPQTGWEVV